MDLLPTFHMNSHSGSKSDKHSGQLLKRGTFLPLSSCELLINLVDETHNMMKMGVRGNSIESFESTTTSYYFFQASTDQFPIQNP